MARLDATAAELAEDLAEEVQALAIPRGAWLPQELERDLAKLPRRTLKGLLDALHVIRRDLH